MQIIDPNNSFNGIFSYSNILIFSNLKTKMPYLLKQFPQFDVHQIEIISESDPTNNKAYITWILKQVVKRFLIFPEDSEKTKKLLSTFNLLKTRKFFKEEKDINKYNSLSELYDVIELYKEHLLDTSNKQQYNEEKKVLDNKGYIEVYNTQPFKILKVISVPVAMQLAKRTNWCVSNKDSAKHYLDMGPLYFIYKNNKEYALLHVESNQLKYTNDHELNMEDRLELEPIFVNNGIINNISYKYNILRDYKYKPTESELKYISSNASLSYNYALKVIKGKFELGEKAIATDAECSCLYSEHIIHSRFELGEKAIATDANFSYYYASNVLKGRFKLGEPIIATSYNCSYYYARDIIKGRFELGEKAIATSYNYSYYYAKEIIKGRFELGEKAILNSTYRDDYLFFLKRSGYDINL